MDFTRMLETLDAKLASDIQGTKPMSATLGHVVFRLVVLLFLPGILGALELTGLLEPVQGLVAQLLAFVPNLIAAVVIGALGWFLAGLLRDIVTSLLTAGGADRMGERVGLAGSQRLSRIAGLLVYLVVFIPAIVSALDALAIDAMSRPATNLLSAIVGVIPGLLGAAIILVRFGLTSHGRGERSRRRPAPPHMLNG